MKPNIILINVDDMGYEDTGCYGSKVNSTPNIDRLAQDGLRFTDFYAAAPLCTPSRAGMMTGCYPKRVSMDLFNLYDIREKGDPLRTIGVLLPGQPEGLNPNERTIASVLKEAGYATKIIGKWHLGDQEEYSPLNYGFDSYLGLPYSNDMGIMPKYIVYKALDLEQPPLPLISDREIIEEQPDLAYLTELYTNTACQYIRENKDHPFFLYFAHMHVHFPIMVREKFKKASQNGRMGAAMAEVDWSVGRLVYELEKQGLTDNTMVIFTSDNGGAMESSNAPLRGYKGNYWEGGQRVNAIVKWPGKVPAGTITSEIATMMDFFPTFAEIAGVDIDDGIIRDGHSILSLMLDPQHTVSQYKYLLFYQTNNLVAIRKGRYKYYIKDHELYDLVADISEKDNIAAQNPDIVNSFLPIIDKARQEIGDDATNSAGTQCRPKGFVEEYKPLTYYNENAPYIIASYDIYDSLNPERGAYRPGEWL